MIKIIFLTVLSWADPGYVPDSLRLETINGKTFVIHQVDDHETLYRISKRYGASIVSILEVNPKADAGLEVGQLLKIPYTAKSKTITSEGNVHKVLPKETLYSISKLYNISTDDIKEWNNLKDGGISVGQELIVKKKSGVRVISKDPETVASGDKHTVESKETLYSIARKYGITVQQLKEWNSIEGSDVKVGTVLIVKNDTHKIPDAKPLVDKPVDKPVVVDTKPVVIDKPVVVDNKPIVTDNKPITADVKSATPTENTITISENVRGSDEIKEAGLAELIEGTEGNRKYLALHRTAKTGTIMKVRNELNNREVFVRVIGSLPSTGVNDKIVIKISKSAYDRLGAIDPKFRAEVTYYK